MPSNRRCGILFPPVPQKPGTRWVRGLVCSLASGSVTSTAFSGQVPSQEPPKFNPNQPYLKPEGDRLPTPINQIRMRDRKIKRDFDAINLQRRKLIAEDSAKLLTLAIALKVRVDGNADRKPSENELRKVDGIEKLAHNVKKAMELTVAPD